MRLKQQEPDHKGLCVFSGGVGGTLGAVGAVCRGEHGPDGVGGRCTGAAGVTQGQGGPGRVTGKRQVGGRGG